MKQITIDFYHNTNQDRERLLMDAVRAGSQTLRIWDLMKDGKQRTSVQVSDALQMNLNSARRGLTDLMSKFNLVDKLASGKMERFGSFNHYYVKR